MNTDMDMGPEVNALKSNAVRRQMATVGGEKKTKIRKNTILCRLRLSTPQTTIEV